MLLAIVAQRRTATNVALAAAAPHGVDARILTPEQAGSLLGTRRRRPRPARRRRGASTGWRTVSGRSARSPRGASACSTAPGALLAAHDKLLTTKVLTRAGLPHPRTRILHPGGPVPDWEGPVVVKPRFGSWGREVERCEDEIALRRHLHELEHRLWFQRHGALLQELVPPAGFDLRNRRRRRRRRRRDLTGRRARRVADEHRPRRHSRPRRSASGRARARGPRRRSRGRGPDRRRPAARRRRRSHRPGAERRRRLHPRLRDRPRPVRRCRRRARPRRRGSGRRAARRRSSQRRPKARSRGVHHSATRPSPAFSPSSVSWLRHSRRCWKQLRGDR